MPLCRSLTVGVALSLLAVGCGSAPRPPLTASPSSPVTSASARPSRSPAVPAPPASPPVRHPVKHVWSPAPAPPGDRILRLDLHDDGSGWALLSVACRGGRCAQLSHTDDHGRSWHRLPVTAIRVDDWPSTCPPACPVHSLRFVTARVGYLYAPGLFLTTDGGRTWRNEKPTSAVEGIEPVGSVVVSATTGWCQARGQSCKPGLAWAETGSNQWHPMRIPGAPSSDHPSLSGSGDGVAYALFSDSLASGVTHETAILRTSNGKTWQTVTDPCLDDGKEPTGLSSSGDRLAVLCAEHGGAGTTNLRLSLDRGRSFAPPLAASVSSDADVAVSDRFLFASSGPLVRQDTTRLILRAAASDGRWRQLADLHLPWTEAGASLGLFTDRSGDVAWIATPSTLLLSHDSGADWTTIAATDI